MIKNLPTYEEFEKVSKECFIQSFNLLFQVYDDYTSYEDETVRAEVSIEDVWKYNRGTLRTSTILLHQGIETYMKSVVAKTSPLLLLEQKRSDWPTMPDSVDKDYDSLYTIAGENLLHTFCAVSSETKPSDTLVSFIEKVRQNRNKAIHGASKISNSAIALIHDILEAYTHFFGIDIWFKDLKAFTYENPLFGYYDWDFESVMSYRYLDFLEATIGLKKFKKYFTFNVAGRRYLCPTCKYEIEKLHGELNSKWAFLHPNTPDSTNLNCINCGFENEIIREECPEENCPGNVLDVEHVCLTCARP